MKAPFKVGDLVTGKDRSFKRSIYKLIGISDENLKNPEFGMFEFQSLGDDVVERWKEQGARVSNYQFIRKFSEFRLATRGEKKEGAKARGMYYLMKMLQRLGITQS
jgi:hypothetical protein